MLKKPNAPQRAATRKMAHPDLDAPPAYATPVPDTSTKAVSIASLYGLEALPDDEAAVIDLASPVDVDSSTEAENALTLLSPGFKPPMVVDKKRPLQESHPAKSSGTAPPSVGADVAMTAEHADVESMTWTQVLSDGSVHKTPLQRGAGGFCEATTRFGLKVTELPNYMLGVEPLMKAVKKTTATVSKKPASSATTTLPSTSSEMAAPPPIEDVESLPAMSDAIEYDKTELLKRWQ
eukprot:4914619-Amphidinium_carterae.1